MTAREDIRARIETAKATRACGPCSLCCKLMSVQDLAPEKPAGQWCPHCPTRSGCGIYEARPQSCRDFDCLWRLGLGSEEMRPDRSHVVFNMSTDGKRIVAHVDPNHPKAHEASIVNDVLIEHARRALRNPKIAPPVVVIGNRRIVVAVEDAQARP